MLDNCFRFAPRDSIPGLIAKICKYLKDHPGWSEEELEEQIKKFISATGVESFNGRTGTVTLDKNDVNSLKIGSAYFADGDESINNLDLVSLYNQGVRFVFTDFNSVTSGYNLSFVLEYFSGSGNVVYYPMSTGSSGGGNIISVNGKTGVVELSLADIIGTSGVQVKLCTEAEFTSTNAARWNAYYNEGYRIVGVVNPSATAIERIYLLKHDVNNHTPIGLSAGASDAYTPSNPPPYPVSSVNNKTGSVGLKVVDVSNGNSTDENAYIFIDENDDYPPAIAEDSVELGGKDPLYYIQPINILDNSDFSLLIAQAGLNGSHGGSAYLADRWKTYSVTGVKSERYTTITSTVKSGRISQFVNVNGGDVYTFAVKVRCGNNFYLSALTNDGASITSQQFVAGDGVYCITFTVPNGVSEVELRFYPSYIDNGGSGDIFWAVLYHGAYDSDTLPPYTPKGYAAEFDECQRYYYRITPTTSSFAYAYGYCYNATQARFNIRIPRPMVIGKPTFSYTAGTYMRIVQNGSTKDITNFSLSAVVGDNALIQATSDGLNSSQTASLMLSGGVFEFIADL